MRVLIAEDDASSRHLLESMLRRLNIDCMSVSDGRTAWERLEGAEAPQLVLLDWMMPYMDGVELCQRLRARPPAHYVYVIMLTSRSETADLVQALEAGADDYMAKPYNLHELRARLGAGERILAQQRQLADAMRRAPTGGPQPTEIMAAVEGGLSRIRQDSAGNTVITLDLARYKGVAVLKSKGR